MTVSDPRLRRVLLVIVSSELASCKKLFCDMMD